MPILDLKTMKVEGEGIKEKAIQFGRDAKQKIAQAGKWCIDHPQEAVMLTGAIGAIAGCATKLTKGILKNRAARLEKFNKERYIYDHSLNAYLKLKRPLKSDDVKRVNAIRRKTGEKLSEVLAKMNLLD